MNSFIDDVIVPSLIITFLSTVIFGIAMVPVYFTSKYGCEQQLAIQNLEGQYGFFTDCMVKTEGGKMVPLDYYNMSQAIKKGTAPDDLQIHIH